MKRRLISGLIVALMLVATMAVPAMAAVEQPVTASVTVSEVLSITITDEPPTGITFGTLSPGTTDNPDMTTTAMDATHPSVTVNVGAETNVSVHLGIKGTDFSPGTLTIDNAKWSTSYVGTKNLLSTSYAEFATGLTGGGSQQLWHWLTVPNGTAAGSHTSTFSYKAVKVGDTF